MSLTETHRLRTPLIPRPGLYVLNPNRCLAEFTTKHFLVASVRGQIDALDGTMTIEDEPLDSWVRVDLNASSLSTGSKERDEVIRNDLLEADRFPVIRFESVAVTEAAPNRFEVAGDLYVRDVVSEIVLDARLSKVTGNRVLFSARAELSRQVFELNFRPVLEKSGVVVSDRITLTLAAEFVR